MCKGEIAMKLTEILEQNAEIRMDVETVHGETVSANSWTIGEEVLRAEIGEEGPGGYSVYISLNHITTVKVY